MRPAADTARALLFRADEVPDPCHASLLVDQAQAHALLAVAAEQRMTNLLAIRELLNVDSPALIAAITEYVTTATQPEGE